MTLLQSPACPESHDFLNLLLSILLTIGIIFSYTPQHYKIIQHKTSEGLSPWFLLLGGVSSSSTVWNLLLLQWDVVLCCRVWSAGTCFENVLGIIQVTAQWCMFSLIIMLYLIYFPPSKKYIPVYRQSHFSAPSSPSRAQPSSYPSSPTATSPLLSASQSSSPTRHGSRFPETTERMYTRQWKISLGIAATVIIYFVVCMATGIGLIVMDAGAGEGRERVIAFGGVLGGIATLMTMFQFLPQIVKTYKRKSVGAVSIPMMCIQTPGTLVLVYSLSLRPNTNISTYLSYLVAATLQGSLLVLCLYYTYHEKKERGFGRLVDDFDDFVEEEDGDEESRLLGASRSGGRGGKGSKDGSKRSSTTGTPMRGQASRNSSPTRQYVGSNNSRQSSPVRGMQNGKNASVKGSRQTSPTKSSPSKSKTGSPKKGSPTKDSSRNPSTSPKKKSPSKSPSPDSPTRSINGQQRQSQVAGDLSSGNRPLIEVDSSPRSRNLSASTSSPSSHTQFYFSPSSEEGTVTMPTEPAADGESSKPEEKKQVQQSPSKKPEIRSNRQNMTKKEVSVDASTVSDRKDTVPSKDNATDGKPKSDKNLAESVSPASQTSPVSTTSTASTVKENQEPVTSNSELSSGEVSRTGSQTFSECSGEGDAENHDPNAASSSSNLNASSGQTQSQNSNKRKKKKKAKSKGKGKGRK